jgi:hypothetical protein
VTGVLPRISKTLLKPRPPSTLASIQFALRRLARAKIVRSDARRIGRRQRTSAAIIAPSRFVVNNQNFCRAPPAIQKRLLNSCRRSDQCRLSIRRGRLSALPRRSAVRHLRPYAAWSATGCRAPTPAVRSTTASRLKSTQLRHWPRGFGASATSDCGCSPRSGAANRLAAASVNRTRSS